MARIHRSGSGTGTTTVSVLHDAQLLVNKQQLTFLEQYRYSSLVHEFSMRAKPRGSGDSSLWQGPGESHRRGPGTFSPEARAKCEISV